MYIKKFESFGNTIKDICKKYGIENYTINQDGSIDVDGNVNLSERELTKLPLKFGKVSGYFLCDNNELTNLEGCPKEVGGSFYCYNNNLTSLEGPKEVGGDFDCSYNELTSLEGSPKEVGGSFDCSYNQLTNLEGSPNIVVGGSFFCFNNKLVSLEGAPDRIVGIFNCLSNPIYNIYKLFYDPSKIELFNDYDIIRDNGESIVLDRLNAFFDEIGKDPVEGIDGYNNI